MFEPLGQLALTPDSPWIRGHCRELVNCKGSPAKARKVGKVHFVGLGASRHLPRGRDIFVVVAVFAQRPVEPHPHTGVPLSISWEVLTGLSVALWLVMWTNKSPLLFKSVWGLPLSPETQLTLVNISGQGIFKTGVDLKSCWVTAGTL